MQPDYNALATQAATQGQNQLNDYTGKAQDYRSQYGNYQQQASDANQNVADYTKYMQNEGSAGNQYHNELGSQLGKLGYDPQQMTAARGNLNQATGALSAYSDFANTAGSKWGLNAGGFAAANAGALSGLNNNIASNQGVVNGLSDLYKTAQTGANQFTGQVVQGQHETLSGLQSTYANAANQRDSAASMMNFYDKLAQQQGGLNAQQQNFYAQAKQAVASASQAMAQAGYILSQTTGQNIQNTSQQNSLNQGIAAQKANAVNKAANAREATSAAVAQGNATNPGAAAQYSKDVSGWDHGLGHMDLLSWLQGHR